MHGIKVRGVNVDQKTRCRHYFSKKDLIAIKFKCCLTYYSCYECHSEIADHPAETWSKQERHVKAILCGACGNELSIQRYMECSFICPHCSAAFNSGCQLHYHLYFD